MSEREEFEKWLINSKYAMTAPLTQRCMFEAWKARAQSDGGAEKRCSWWKDMDDWDGNNWESDCGASWVFIDEGPVQNEMQYCPKCGKKLSQLPAGSE